MSGLPDYKTHNKSLDPTPRSEAALRGMFLGGAVQRKRYVTI